MTTHWKDKISTCLAIILVIGLLLFLITIWIEVSNGMFSQKSDTNRINISDNNNKTAIDHHHFSKPNWLKENRNRFPTIYTASSASESSKELTNVDGNGDNINGVHPTITDDIDDISSLDHEGIDNVEYIKPTKIHGQPLHVDDLLYESKNYDSGSAINTDNPDQLSHHHVTGHFRNRSSRIWDPHPQYEIDAFGLHMHLILYHDGDFMPKDIKVTHIWPNETLRLKEDHKEHDKLKGCFYKGHVRGDEKSTVAVSLCDGMRGHIRTSSGSFFIQPVENYTSENTNILHAVYRVANVPKTHEHITTTKQPTDDLSGASGGQITTSTSMTTAKGVMDEKEKSNCALPNSVDGFDLDKEIQMDEMLPPMHIHNNHNRNRRYKRSSNSHSVSLNPNNNNAFTMEVLVAVDKKMQEYHGDAIQSYVLTLMSIVSSIYADASIGNSINVAVVHIMLLKHDLVADANRIGVSASNMLIEFCNLKQRYNFHHDTALLLTREQICRSADQKKCDTLGLAELGTMCKTSSCAIVQDNGLSAAFTIAHELGHVLNMPHDDDTKCEKYRDTTQTKQNIMSRMLDHNTHPWSWSNCSKHFVTEYLEHSNGNCMLDKPEHDMIEPTSIDTILAGEKFTNDQQCELVFGPGSKICSYMPVCGRLWCSEDDQEVEGCRTQHMPWADGTTCGDNQWCQKGECVFLNRSALMPTDGVWGHWKPYGECSRTCGGGVQTSTRACDSPAPSNGGRYCPGIRIKYRSCNVHNCPVDTIDFREEQCRELDDNNFDIPGLAENVKWVPKFGAATAEECKLYCRVQKANNYFLLKDKVKDGTSCTQDGFNKCVNGICRPAGCDNELNSAAILDKCGVCKGKNDTCIEVHGSFTKRQKISAEQATLYYYKVAKIPKGALNIEIVQPGHANDQNYIALKDDQNGYLLNGNNLLTPFSSTFPYSGVTFDYMGVNSSLERVNSTYARPLKRDLYIELLSVSPDETSDEELIRYSYSFPVFDPNSPHHKSSSRFISHNHLHNQHKHHNKDRYRWVVSDWTECDNICYGKHFRKPICVQVDNEKEVPHHYCPQLFMPAQVFTICNANCQLEVKTIKSECSNNCGEGVQTIKKTCMKKMLETEQYIPVDDSYCTDLSSSNTITHEKCLSYSCPDSIHMYSDWGPCSKTCGGGYQNRTVKCLSHRNGHEISMVHCRKRIEPLRSFCNPESCPEWAYGEDTPCSVTCGEGTRSKVILCKQDNVVVNSALCGSYPRPIMMLTNCTNVPCKKKVPEARTVDFYDDHIIIAKRGQYDLNNMHNIHSNAIPNINYSYDWRAGRWSTCSTTCGIENKKMRSVHCYNKTLTGASYVDDKYCNQSKRPINVTSCGHYRCPVWSFGQFGECTDDCKRYRQVVCRDHRGQVDKSLCPAESEPPHLEMCCHFRWRNIWKPCSVTCGIGEKIGERVCMRLDRKTKENPHPFKKGKHVSPKYCDHLKNKHKKPLRKQCKRQCDFRWEHSAWSECSVGCGTGFATRNVTCTNGRMLSATSNECDGKSKPINYKQCDSRSHCRWVTKNWKNCTCSGFRKRRSICMDYLLKKESTSCSESDRPIQKERCLPPPNCSCNGIKQQRDIRRDGEYLLNVRGKKLWIYCHKMNSDKPQEYLTLKAGMSENYALYYDKRSKDSSQCPVTTRSGEWDDDTIPSGTTRFSKVKLNLHNLQVIEDDFEFAETSGRKPITFGSAGDCYSNTGLCPQGHFSINLNGTGFRIRQRTHWDVHGQNASIEFVTRLESSYLKVVAKCGGYCGSCAPAKNTTLLLEVL